MRLCSDSTFGSGGNNPRVRPEIAKSAIHHFEAQREFFAAEDPKLSEAFSALADAIRADRPLPLSDGPYGPAMAAEAMSSVRYELGQITEDGREPHDWRYLSDLASLMADIEDVAPVLA